MSFANAIGKNLGKNLRRLMQDRKISVAELSKKTGVPTKTIYHWFTGQQPRKIEYVFIICDTLKISIDELYGRKPEASSSDLLNKDIQLNLQQELNAGIYEVILRPIKSHSKI